MTIQRMDNVAIVVEDLDAAVAFFTELGMELEGGAQIEGTWADRDSRRQIVCDTRGKDRAVHEPTAYDRAMGLFRNAMSLFRGKAGEDREEGTAELPQEQATTVKPQPVVASREVKREARPDPNKPGWGQTAG